VPTVLRGLWLVAFWRQALDQIDIGLVHQLQKLPRIGRQAFHIAALAFGIEGVKGQTALARARQARDHHQTLARDVDVQRFEVVGARATDADEARTFAQGLGQRSARVVGTGRLRQISHTQEKNTHPLHGPRESAPARLAGQPGMIRLLGLPRRLVRRSPHGRARQSFSARRKNCIRSSNAV
jgi:hypothetical protein